MGTPRRARVRAAVAGAAADRTPVALWSAWRGGPDLSDPDAYARIVLERWDRDGAGDLLKAAFPGELPEGPAATTAAYVAGLRRVREFLPEGDPPVLIATLRGTLATADDENGGRTAERLRDAPAATHARLREVAGFLTARARALVTEGGCDGVYVVLHLPPAETLGAEAYNRAFGALERDVLRAAAGDDEAGWCRIAHLHGGPWPDTAADPYIAEAAVVSWADRACGPGIAAVRARTGKCLMAGLDERTLAGYAPERAAEEAADALAAAGGGGFVLAPGCALPPTGIPAAVREAVWTAANAPSQLEPLDSGPGNGT